MAGEDDTGTVDTIDRTSDDWDGTGQDEDGTDIEDTDDLDSDEATEDEPTEGDDAEAQVSDDVAPAEEAEGEPLRPAQARKLREEAHGLRERVKGYEEAFSGLGDEQRAAYLDSARLLATDPQAWAAEMEPILAHIKGQADAPAPTPDADDDRPPTKAEIEKMWEEREAKKEKERTEAEQQRQIVEAINQEMTDLGYDPKAEKGTADFRRATMLRTIAINETDGDLKRAHELLEEDRRGAVRAVADKKQRQANGSTPVAQGQAGAKTKTLPPMYLPGTTRINPEWEKAFDEG